MILGSVLSLSVRSARALLPACTETAEALAGLGLAGDIHADALSPRQLLLASAAAYADLHLPPHALRENLLLDIDTAPLASGTVLQVGEARIRLMFQCEACGQLDASQAGLSARIGARRGMLARVVTGGAIRAGDPVRDLGVRLPAWPEDWRERVRQVLDAVPAGCVLEYRQLARLAGIQSSYCRAFPRAIARLGDRYAARAVSSQSASPLARWSGEGLFDLATT
ncbi:MAG: MOSC domain-containing protein [Pseudomonadota bacterium]